MSPFCSIILVTWNSAAHLPRCLGNLNAQRFTDFEVVVIDNGSTDGSLDALGTIRWNFPMRIERLPSNIGFAAANNIGARLAQGEWLALLNADAYPEPGWLENLVTVAEDNPQFNFFSPRQIRADNPEMLDGAGDAYHISGLAWRQGYNLPAALHGLQMREVFGACAAASLYRRDDFLRAGGFDETYFSYYEDVDLSFRLRLAGGRCLYVPQAVVHHVGSASTGKTSDFAYYHIHRNMVWVYFKNMPMLLFWCFLPIHILANIYLAVSFLIKEKRTVALRAKWDAILGIPSVLRVRRTVQAKRIAALRDLYHIMAKDLLPRRRASHTRI